MKILIGKIEALQMDPPPQNKTTTVPKMAELISLK
jgi:hypothetical protein